MEISKDLTAAAATPLILAILSEGENYGYAIIKKVFELSEQKIKWTDGMMYPVLHRLEKLGHVNSFWKQSDSGRNRKYYKITEEGKKELENMKNQWQTVQSMLKEIGHF